jgi:hypothetical protein
VPGGEQVTLVATVAASPPDPEPANNRVEVVVAAGGSGVPVLGGGGVIPTAIAISQRRFPEGTAPTGVVLSRDDVFADSLGGAVLTRTAPLLFTDPATLDVRTAAEIDRLLGGAGTVTLLGGEAALEPAVAAVLDAAGYAVRRLAGASRVETAVVIATAATEAPEVVALARADGPPHNPTAAWADAVTAGAWSAATRSPVLLTSNAALHPAVSAYLDQHDPREVVLLGGEAALGPPVADAVGPHRRIQGPNRFATAAAIAEDLWPAPTTGFLLTGGDHEQGWAYALAAAGLAADQAQPLLLAERYRLPAETRTAVCRSGDLAPQIAIGGPEVLDGGVLQTAAQPC